MSWGLHAWMKWVEVSYSMLVNYNSLMLVHTWWHCVYWHNLFFFAASTSTLTVVTNPTDSDGFPDNRVAVSVGNNQLLRCIASGSSSPPSSVVWIRNGEQMVTGSRISITEEIINLNQQRSSELEIAYFSLSDAGVYQCIFTDDVEVITTTPLRLDAGWYILPTHWYIITKMLYLLAQNA